MNKNLKKLALSVLSIFCLAAMFVVESPAYAFPKASFSDKNEISKRYDEMAKAYDFKYSSWGIKSSKRIKTMENKIALAYKNLAKAKTEKLKSRYESQIVQYRKNLDAELLRLSKLAKPQDPTTTSGTEQVTKPLDTVVASGWASVDTNCAKPDVSVGSQVWAGCNSTIGSTAETYSGTCENYIGTSTASTSCMSVTAKENWPGISASAPGYSVAISGISTNVYGALYRWDTMGLNGCFASGIAGSDTFCPCKAGYHVPTHAEWDTLETNLGCSGENKLTGDTTGYECTTMTSDSEANAFGWTATNPNSLRNRLGFSLAGYCVGGWCGDRGHSGYYWSSSAFSSGGSWYRRLRWSFMSIYRDEDAPDLAYSVRCLKD